MCYITYQRIQKPIDGMRWSVFQSNLPPFSDASKSLNNKNLSYWFCFLFMTITGSFYLKFRLKWSISQHKRTQNKISYLSIAQIPVRVECTKELEMFLHFQVVWAPDFKTEVGVNGLSNKWVMAKKPTLAKDQTGPLIALPSPTLAILECKRYVTTQQ